MSNCKIVYDNQGNKIGVSQNNQLFQEILNNPLNKNFDSALEIFLETYSGEFEMEKRVADKLPLTLSVFDNKSFVEMRGKQVNPITVQQILNGGGIKQIEKDLINQVIEDNYKGQKKVSFDELEATVRANIMPLERITTSSYADYGMDNLGSGNYGEAKTLILNAPIEHGVTGHFSGDFKASGRQNIKYQAKQLNDNVWVAVEEGYEANANDNNIYQYVGTAGTKEAVDVWINQYNGGREVLSVSDNTIEYNIIYPTEYDSNVQITRQIAVDLGRGSDYLGSAQIEYDKNLSEEQIKKQAVDVVNQKNKNRFTDNYESNINKGMFGHIRVWQDGDIFYGVELQSDYFQKNNARKEILEKNKDYKNAKFEYDTDLKEIQLKKDLFFTEYQDLFLTEIEKLENVEIKPHKLVLYDGTTSDEEYLWLFVNGEPMYKSNYQTNSNYSLEMQRTSIIKGKNLKGLVDELGKEILEKIDNDVREPIKPLEKEIKIAQKKFDNAVENIIKGLSPQEKQFIASQKIWEQRMVREAIKEASLSGATSLRFPTPYTLSVIEGYVSKEEVNIPYNIVSSYNGNEYVASPKETDIVKKGDTIIIEDTKYLVINSTDSQFKVANLEDDITNFLIQDIRDNKNNQEYSPTQGEIIEHIGKDFGNGIMLIGEQFIDVSAQETFGQPNTYKTSSKDNFNISDLDDTQQTVARKYEEIAEILKKEKPVEVVTDENGFDWYEAPITQEDTQNPVVAFSLSEESPTLKYQTQDGQVFSDYGQALRNTQGEDLEAGINSVSGFKRLFTISSNTNISTTEGMINNLIKSDLLSGEKYLENGVNYYKPQGKSEAKQIANAQVVKDLLQQKFGVKAVKVSKDGFISIIEENKRENISLAGKVVKISDLHKMDFKELKDNFGEDTAINILANNLFLDASQKTSTKELKEEFIPEDELQEKLINLLKKFGIKTLAFEEYIKKYQIRNKLPINARALADLANKVIAFKDGNIENDDLVEETSHLIVASIPEEKKANIKRNIHKTKEWGQYSEGYKQIYATEDEVREEILGKVVANSIKEQFQARNTNQTEDSIINKIREFVQEFFDRISAYFQDSFQKELDTLNKAVYNNLMQETLQLDLSKATGVFFNATEASPKIDNLKNKLDKMVEGLRQIARELSKSTSNSTDRASLNLAEDALEKGEFVRAIATLTQLIDSQVNQINRSLEDTKEGQLPISAEENVVAQALKETMIPSLAEVSAKLSEKDPTEKALLNEVREVISKANTVFGKVTTARKTTFNYMVENMIEKYNMTEKEKAEYQNMINLALSGVQQDTDFLHAHIGSLLLAKNPLLNMAGLIIERMNLRTKTLGQPLVKGLVDNTGKFSNTDLLKLRDTKTNDLVQETDIELDRQLKTAQKIEIANKLLAKVGLEVRTDENTDFQEFFKKLEDENVGIEFNSQYNQWEEDNVKLFYFGDSYREALKTHSIDNFFTDGTTLSRDSVTYSAIDIDRALRGEATKIRMNAKGGVLTKSDEAELKKVEKLRAERSNPRDSEGNLLKGIKEYYNENLQKWVIEKDVLAFSQITSTEEQKRISDIIGLNQLNYLKQDFYKNRKDKDGKTDEEKIKEKFLEELGKLQTKEEKQKFLEANSNISFPREFFDSFKENPNLVQRLLALGTDEALEKVKQIRAKESLRNKVMREISVYNKPGETNFVEMHSTQKETIKLAQTELENLYNQAKKLLPKDEAERTELNIDSRVNDAYQNHLDDSGEDELEFIMKNVTSTGLSAIEGMRVILVGSKPTNKTFDKYFTDDLINDRGELKPQARQALIEYGKTRLLPYLKKTEPLGYTEAKERLSVEEFINRTDLVTITPSISFSERFNENVNQEYLDNRDAGKPQIRKEWLKKTRSKQYDDLFANNKNPELKQTYDNLKTLMAQAIEMQGLTGKVDVHTTPQVRATEIERFTRLNPKAIGQSIQEIFQYRPEEKELGEQTAQGIYTIPTYYNRRLEDQSEVTNNFIYAYAMYFTKAAETKARRENIGDMFVIDDVLSDTKFENKKVDATQTYKMFQNFKYFNFYGVQDSFSYEVNIPILNRTIDIGKTMKVFNNFGKKINLTTFSVPITSLGQSFTAKAMERFIGQYITPTASNEGNRLYKQHASDAVKESMGFQSKSFLNVTMEALGLYSLTHRLEDSQYNKAGRTLYNVGNKLHEIANFPVVPRAVLGIICDYRYVDGKIIDEKTFKKLNKPGNWTDYKMLKDDWALAIKDGVLDFNNEVFVNAIKDKITLREGQSLEQYMQDIRLNISTRALAFVQQVDSQIPQHQKSVAQRDARINFFLSHMGWLTSAIPKRLRNRHFSYAEGEFQEGSWRTVWELIRNSKGNPRKMQELYKNMDDFQKKNIVRGGMELAFANALALVALVLANYNDDDEDPNYLLAVADMFATRIANEQISSTVALPNSIYKAMSPSIMLKQKMEAWVKVNQLFDSEKQGKYLGNLVPFFRDITRFQDPIEYRQSYQYLQMDNKDVLYNYAWSSNFLKE